MRGQTCTVPPIGSSGTTLIWGNPSRYLSRGINSGMSGYPSCARKASRYFRYSLHMPLAALGTAHDIDTGKFQEKFARGFCTRLLRRVLSEDFSYPHKALFLDAVGEKPERTDTHEPLRQDMQK